MVPRPHLFKPRDDNERRLIEPGDFYTIDEENEIELREVIPFPEPDVNVQGETWEWTKKGPRPKGWPGPNDSYRWRDRDDPGPYNGQWEPPVIARPYLALEEDE